MSFQPSANLILLIDGASYYVAEDPDQAGAPLSRTGRHATIYQLIAGSPGGAATGARRALKLHQMDDRLSALTSQATALAAHADLPGLTVCRRVVLDPQRHWNIIRRYPDLTFAPVMPWIDGPTWAEMVQGRRAVSAEQSLALARALLDILVTLERRHLAHCELGGQNVIVSALPGTPTPDVPVTLELVDVEHLYAPDLSAPATPPVSPPGYAHLILPVDLWQAESDRYTGAMLLAEMLGWCDPRVRQAAWGASYFEPGDMRQESPRYRLLTESLRALWGDRVVWLLARAWFSGSLLECASFTDWSSALPSKPLQAPPAPATTAAAEAGPAAPPTPTPTSAPTRPIVTPPRYFGTTAPPVTPVSIAEPAPLAAPEPPGLEEPAPPVVVEPPVSAAPPGRTPPVVPAPAEPEPVAPEAAVEASSAVESIPVVPIEEPVAPASQPEPEPPALDEAIASRPVAETSVNVPEPTALVADPAPEETTPAPLAAAGTVPADPALTPTASMPEGVATQEVTAGPTDDPVAAAELPAMDARSGAETATVEPPAPAAMTTVPIEPVEPVAEPATTEAIAPPSEAPATSLMSPVGLAPAGDAARATRPGLGPELVAALAAEHEEATDTIAADDSISALESAVGLSSEQALGPREATTSQAPPALDEPPAASDHMPIFMPEETPATHLASADVEATPTGAPAPLVAPDQIDEVMPVEAEAVTTGIATTPVVATREPALEREGVEARPGEDEPPAGAPAESSVALVTPADQPAPALAEIEEPATDQAEDEPTPGEPADETPDLVAEVVETPARPVAIELAVEAGDERATEEPASAEAPAPLDEAAPPLLRAADFFARWPASSAGRSPAPPPPAESETTESQRAEESAAPPSPATIELPAAVMSELEEPVAQAAIDEADISPPPGEEAAIEPAAPAEALPIAPPPPLAAPTTRESREEPASPTTEPPGAAETALSDASPPGTPAPESTPRPTWPPRYTPPAAGPAAMPARRAPESEQPDQGGLAASASPPIIPAADLPVAPATPIGPPRYEAPDITPPASAPTRDEPRPELAALAESPAARATPATDAPPTVEQAPLPPVASAPPAGPLRYTTPAPPATPSTPPSSVGTPPVTAQQPARPIRYTTATPSTPAAPHVEPAPATPASEPVAPVEPMPEPEPVPATPAPAARLEPVEPVDLDPWSGLPDAPPAARGLMELGDQLRQAGDDEAAQAAYRLARALLTEDHPATRHLASLTG